MNTRSDNIVDILVRRDGMTREEAVDMLYDARLRVANGENPEDILYEEFSLEPDYIWQLID